MFHLQFSSNFVFILTTTSILTLLISSAYASSETIEQQEDTSWNFTWISVTFNFTCALLVAILFFLNILLYVATAVVYILRKDKDLVFRCSIVCSSISMIVQYFCIPCIIIFAIQLSFQKLLVAVEIFVFSFLYAFSWMSVLCFDVWFNITFLSIEKRSMKRLWGYIALTLTLLIIMFTFVFSLETANHNSLLLIVSGSMLLILLGGLICVNFLLFLATVLKLCIAQHSSIIKTQRNTFLLYFKLFLLVGLHSVADFLVAITGAFHLGIAFVLYVGILLLKFVHPILLFFFLVWDVETKKYLETKHPRIKSILEFMILITYPVRKCCGLCRCCKRSQDQSRIGEIEPLHCSTHMYVHKGGAPKIQEQN